MLGDVGEELMKYYRFGFLKYIFVLRNGDVCSLSPRMRIVDRQTSFRKH